MELSADFYEEEEKKAEDVITGNETILLVDDEAVILDVGKKMMQFLGYRVITATSGAKALEVYPEHGGKVDLVILDLIMPGMSGCEWDM